MVHLLLMILKIIAGGGISLRGFLIPAVIICGSALVSSSVFAQDYRMSCNAGVISLSADRADLKSILADIAKEANIFVRFPQALEKQITIRLSNVSIRSALRRLLRGLDYAIVYSALKKQGHAIAEVYVLPEQWGGRKPAISPALIRRRNNIIGNYKKRLDSLRNRLAGVNRGSAAESRILRQIQWLEKTAEMIEKKLPR